MEELQGCLWLYNRLNLKAMENQRGPGRVTMDYGWACRCNQRAKKSSPCMQIFIWKPSDGFRYLDCQGKVSTNSLDLCFILLSVQISPLCHKASGAGEVPVLAVALLPGSGSIPAQEVTAPMGRKVRSQTHTKMVFQPERATGVKKIPQPLVCERPPCRTITISFFYYFFFMVGLTIKRLHCALVFPVCCIV